MKFGFTSDSCGGPMVEVRREANPHHTKECMNDAC